MAGLKLHLGSGAVHFDGWTNIDHRYQPGVDAVDDGRHLRRHKPGTVDEIYACHILEHLSRWEYGSVLQRWCELLKPGGVLWLSVPDFDAIVSHYRTHDDLPLLIGLLYGGQDWQGNEHHYVWSFDTMRTDLLAAGFRWVERYDWRKSPFADKDDYSKAYLPHGDQKHGTLMSLNVKAVK